MNVKKAATRDGFGKGLVEAGRKDKRVIVLVADLTSSTRMQWFKEEFPERFVEVGVAEQNLITLASGMAAVGKIPFAASYAVFSPGRNWEQIRTTVCINDVPVKIVSTHAGISVGADGRTHQALEDIAMMRALPNMTVLSPTDAHQAYMAALAAAQWDGPVYLRLHRHKTPIFTAKDEPFEIGKAYVLREGSDITLAATGPLVYEALLAADSLSGKISVEVLNISTIKPFDQETFLVSAAKTGNVITVEEHQIWGGLGGAVAEILSENYPVPLKRLGTSSFGESGEPHELLEKYGLVAKAIVRTARSMVK